MFREEVICDNVLNVQINSDIRINDNTYYVIVWVEKDSTKCVLNFNERELNANSIVALCPGEVFHAVSKYNNAFTILFFKKSPNTLLKLYLNPRLNNGHFENSILKLSENQANQIKPLFNNIIRLSKNENEHFFMECCTDKILLEILNIRIEKEYAIALLFDELVLNYYRTNHMVVDYANQLKMTPKQLLIKLNKQGLNKPYEVIKRKLIIEAKKELVFTKKSIKEICYELGFDDPAYFARFFKKNSGMTALKFRKQFDD